MAKNTIREWQAGGPVGMEGQVDVPRVGHVSLLEHGVARHDGESGTTYG